MDHYFGKAVVHFGIQRCFWTDQVKEMDDFDEEKIAGIL